MKKLASSLIIASLIAIIGAVFVTADADEDAEKTEDYHFPYRFEKIYIRGAMGSDLSEEQQTEIDDLIDTLNEEGASPEEIREAVSQKLDEMGILDERLDNAIANTEEKLQMLNRQRELRDQGYSWDEINDIIKEEFDLECPSPLQDGRPHGHGFDRGFDWNKGDVPRVESEDESNNGLTSL